MPQRFNSSKDGFRPPHPEPPRQRRVEGAGMTAGTKAGSLSRMGERIYFVYLLASRFYGTLYVGVTNDIIARTYDHKAGEIPGFTKRYGVHRLVWFETHRDVREAIAREKRIKEWRRDWKINLIEADNRHWDDLYPNMIAAGWRVER